MNGPEKGIGGSTEFRLRSSSERRVAVDCVVSRLPKTLSVALRSADVDFFLSFSFPPLVFDSIPVSSNPSPVFTSESRRFPLFSTFDCST